MYIHATPVINGARIAPSAIVRGDVHLEKDCSVWHTAVIRGDKAAIRVGEGTNIQDGCVLHNPVTIGKLCTIGHRAIIHGCTIGDHCLIGSGSIVLDGAELGDYCLVAAGSLVTGKTKAPAGSLLMGSPAKIVREISPEQRATIERNALEYIEFSKNAAADENW